MFHRDLKKIRKIVESKTTFVFDFDGVLADSVHIKTWAFGQLYKQYGEKVVEKVVSHHIANGGMSRFEKFRFYHMNYLNKELSQDDLEELCDSFSEIVMNEVINSPEIRGVSTFLDYYFDKNKLFFVNSATPHDEIQEIISQRKMNKYFKCIYGSPSSKLDNLRSIFSDYNTSPQQTVFFGDAVADFNAAEISGCEFIAVGNDIEKSAHVVNQSEQKKRYGLLLDFNAINRFSRKI